MTREQRAWVAVATAEPLAVRAAAAERMLRELPEGWTLDLAGPAALTSMHRRVRVLVGPVVHDDSRLVRYLAWESAAQPGLFPRFEGSISVRAARPGALLEVRARYLPPLGAVGQLADRAVLHVVAAAAVRGFAHEVAERIGQAAGPGPSGTGPTVPGEAPATRPS